MIGHPENLNINYKYILGYKLTQFRSTELLSNFNNVFL